MKKRCYPVFIISRLTSGEVRRLSTYSGGFDPRTRYQHAIVVLGEGRGLSIRIRWVRVPSMAPILLSESKHGVGASLLTKNELGSIPSRTAKQLGAVMGYGVALQASWLEGFDSLGLHQFLKVDKRTCVVNTCRESSSGSPLCVQSNGLSNQFISLKRYQVAYTVWGRVVQVQILVGRPSIMHL